MNIDNLELPMDDSRQAIVGAAIAQLGELLGRSLRLGPLKRARALSKKERIIALQCEGGYCSIAEQEPEK